MADALPFCLRLGGGFAQPPAERARVAEPPERACEPLAPATFDPPEPAPGIALVTTGACEWFPRWYARRVLTIFMLPVAVGDRARLPDA